MRLVAILVSSVLLISYFLVWSRPVVGQSGLTEHTFIAVADAFVKADRPTKNYGGHLTLRAKKARVTRSYLRFDVQGLTGQVSTATLRVFAVSNSQVGYKVRAVSDNTWNEQSLTFENAPRVSRKLGGHGSFGNGEWTNIDVTALVSGNGVYNLALVTGSGRRILFSSRESGANAPHLVISTVSTATPTSTSTPTPTRTFTPIVASPTNTHTATRTPTFTATAASPTNTHTATPTPTFTATVASPTNTHTATPTPTFTATVASRTNTHTATRTPTFTATAASPTNTHTATRTPTFTATAASPTNTHTATPTPTFTATAASPTNTHTATPTSTDPVFVGAGDIAHCTSTGDEETATLLDGIPGSVFVLGDIAYPSGTPQEFANCYDPSWGRHKSRTYPVPGNHEYKTAGAAGYYAYFGSAAGDPTKGYYSFDLGSWHIIALNSEIPVNAGSVQEQWLRADLAAHSNTCTLAYWHRPRFSSNNHGDNPDTQDLWQALYDYDADVILSGHDHGYERYQPQTATGTADPVRGIREFVVGTGGKSHYNRWTVPSPTNSQVRNGNTYGVLKLTLRQSSYDWLFVPVAGKTFTDSGSHACH